MKLNIKFNKKHLYRDIPVLVLAAYMLACVSITGIDYEKHYKAGETATFTVDMEINTEEGKNDSKLIVAILVPKSWKAASNTTVTYTDNISSGTKLLKIVPETVQPLSKPGMTWPQALRAQYDFAGNVLEDMEWIAFQSEEVYSVVKDEQLTAKIKFVTKIGPENMRVKLAFFVNHSQDGLGDSKHYKMQATDCIDIVEGTGEVVDFCELHFNMVQPAYSNKDDIVTFKFQGDIASNALDDAQAIYFYSVAYTDAGKEYPVTDRTAKTKMMRESEYGRTYSLTCWPADYYGIPENESITWISYFFTNEDGTVWVKSTPTEGTEIPFERQFTCGD